jgi:hypothetical protein
VHGGPPPCAPADASSNVPGGDGVWTLEIRSPPAVNARGV